jgi:hypothetical protein
MLLLSRSIGDNVPKKLLFAILIAMPLTAVADQPQHATRPHAQSRLAEAAEVTTTKGISAKLPPHISTLLRITNEQECPVKQAVIRSGSLIQGLDVSEANKNDIVIFTVDEGAGEQILYLTSPDGTLRRVVTVKAGVGSEIRITDKERRAFEKEKQFWIDRLVPATKGK